MRARLDGRASLLVLGLVAYTAYSLWRNGVPLRLAAPLGLGVVVAGVLVMQAGARWSRWQHDRRERAARARRRTAKAWEIATDWRGLGAWVKITEMDTGIVLIATRECPPRARQVGEARVWMWRGVAMVEARERQWLADRRRELGRDPWPEWET